MSAVEEALERIKEQKGVEGYVICNSEGAVLRRSSAIVKANAEVIAQSMTKLIQTTMNGVRDLNPNDNLKNLRIKTTKKEMLVSHSNEFVVIVIHDWQPAKEEQSHLVATVQKQPKSIAASTS
jgi:dynein light chain roadblock-type